MEENQPAKLKRRPTKYTKRIGDRLCAQLSMGKSLRQVLREDDQFPSAVTVYSWLRVYPEFLKQYEIATHDRAESMADEILDIADDGSNDYMTITKGDHSYNGVDLS